MDILFSLAEESGAGPGLDETLRILIDDLRRVVDSYLGLTLTLRHDGFPVTFTALEDCCDPADIRASLRLPSSALAEIGVGSVLDLYAGTPGAFVDLAADVCHALHLRLDQAELDHHLKPPGPISVVIGARRMSHINQAVGILVSHGQTPEDARTELRRRARHDGSTVAYVARDLIRATLHGSDRAMH